MRTTMNKLILASLLLSTALLAAGPAYAAPLYFPHVATSIPWQTEIAIINTSDQTVTGTLRGLSDEGQLIETKDVTLSARGRRQINVADEFTNHISIGYIIFVTDSAAVEGYTKFYREGYYRAAIPAVKEVNTADIYISHIASTADWWTGVSLVNTTSAPKALTITFNNGQSVPYTLNANEHRAFDIASLFNNQPQPDIQSAVITNASGIIGLELFGSNDGGGNHLDGILLTDNTASTIYYPHVASDNVWWTGIVAYNPSGQESYITITPYSAQGILLSASTLTIAEQGKYIGAVSELGLPAQTAWFKIDSTRPLSGFELFGTIDGNQLAAYAEGGGTGAKTGVFAKIEKNGWTGIAFVNTEDSAASVTLTAYNDNGSAVATQVLPVGGHAKVVKVAEAIFTQDISSATYIAYSSDRNVVGFQLNGSSDGMMLDGLPGRGGGGSATPTFTLALGQGTLTGPIPASGNSTLSTSIQVVPAGGFTGTVTFTIEGVPSGVTATFSPTASATSASLQLTIASAAVPGTTLMTVKGSTPGVTTASAKLNLTLTASSAADKLPILATVEEKCRNIGNQGLTPLEQARAIAAFMQGRAEYVNTGVDEETLSAWGELQNGRLHVVTTAPAPVKISPSSPSMVSASKPDSRQFPIQARIASSQANTNLSPAAATNGNAIPGSSYARLLHSFGANFEGQDPINDAGGWLKDAGWTLRSGAEGDASIAVLKTVKGDGFFYINSHGGVADKSSTGTHFYCLSSSTVQSSKLDDTPEYKDDWDNYRIVYITGRNGEKILGGLWDDWNTWYGITYAFVNQYWSFAPNSVVWINACNSQGTTPSTYAFRFACQQKGAGVYLGWTNSLSSGAAYSSIRYFVDRCVGANKYSAEYPAQRPFPWDLVMSDMTAKGLTQGANGEVLQATPQTPGTPPCLLAPSIRLVEVDEYSYDMKLKGAFGSDQGEVTVGGSPIAVKSWGAEEILCTLPKEASGDVRVTVRSLKSNLRPLTEWNIPLKYTWTTPGGVIKFTGTANLRYRLDVSGFRNKPGDKPTYLRRGTWPVLGSGITFTGTGNVSPCSLTGGTVTLPSIPSDQSPTAFITAPLIVDGNTQTGLLGLAVGIQQNRCPWQMVCPGSPSVPTAPSFGLLQVQGSFYQTQAEDDPGAVGPITALVVTYGTNLELKDGSYSDARAGALKVEWQGATQTNPPRPGDAGI